MKKLIKNLLRYLTLELKKFDLETDYFKKKIDIEKSRKKKMMPKEKY